MQVHPWSRPHPGDHAAYFDRYVTLVPKGDVILHLQRQFEETYALLTAIDDEAARYRYAAAKWSIKEIVGHITDTEIIFASRCLRFARQDKAELPGFDQDHYVANADFDERPLLDLLDEFGAVRRASVCLLQGLSEQSRARSGVASGNKLTVRSVPYILAGHELHHVAVIRRLYLDQAR